MNMLRKGMMLALILIGSALLPGEDCDFDFDLDHGGYWTDVPIVYEEYYYDPWVCCW